MVFFFDSDALFKRNLLVKSVSYAENDFVPNNMYGNL